jgi:hypothetical protein
VSVHILPDDGHKEPEHPIARGMHSKPKLCYDRRSIGESVLVSSTHLIPKTKFLLLSDSCGFFDWGASSDEVMDLSLTIAAGPRQRSYSRVRVPRDS